MVWGAVWLEAVLLVILPEKTGFVSKGDSSKIIVKAYVVTAPVSNIVEKSKILTEWANIGKYRVIQIQNVLKLPPVQEL